MPFGRLLADQTRRILAKQKAKLPGKDDVIPNIRIAGLRFRKMRNSAIRKLETGL